MTGAQVRNLKSCIKVAIDFVSPESAAQCLELMQERRQLTLRENKDGEEEPEAPEDRRHCDKLQVCPVPQCMFSRPGWG